MSNTRTLEVLLERDDVKVATLEGAANPVVVLDDNAMSRILLLLRDIRADKEKSASVVSTLLAELDAMVDDYRITRNKFYGDVSKRVEVANLQREVERLMSETENLFGKPR